MAIHLSKGSNEHLLKVQLDVLTAQNVRLTEENNLMNQKLQRFMNDQRSNAAVNVEAKIKALQFEDERDRLYESLERLKKKYNKLHKAYLEKVQRCKALEETFRRQKTLPGLVYKTSCGQRAKEMAALSASENLEKQVTKLQVALDEAYDIIDELEFEVDSVDVLEVENQRLREKLSALEKSQKPNCTTPLGGTVGAPIYDEPPPSYNAENEGAAAVMPNTRRLSAASSSAESFGNDDADSETLERAAMTHSLLLNAEAESNQLRRELLKCRLRERNK